MRNLLLFLLSFPIFLLAQNADQEMEHAITTIAFGSCSQQSKVDDQLWNEVNTIAPDLWVWLGDNIYGDSEDMKVLRKKYELQKSHPDYEALLSQTKVIGIWDDHDFGVNDGGKEYLMKDESKEELFHFLDVDEEHPARKRKGAYQSYSFRSNNHKIKVILLDARYFRDPLKKDEKNWNIPDKSGEILGEEQWTWFEEQLQDASIDFFIIGNGIQVIPKEHRFEKWANFPKERDRLFDAVSEHVDKPVILLSGDRHMSEVSKINLADYPYPLYEFTSSSLTNPWGEIREEVNQFREKNIVYQSNFAHLDISFKGEKLKAKVTYYGKENEVLQKHELSYKLE